MVVGVWVGNDDRTPTKGVTGGALPAQIWHQFVSAATPLAGRTKEPAVVAAAPPTTSSPPTSPACNEAACAARFNSFRSSDCTYQPYAGSRRLCELPERSSAGNTQPWGSMAARDVDPAEPDRGRSENPSGEGARKSDRRSRRPHGGMSLNGPGARSAPVYGFEAPRGPFGPSVFRRLDRHGNY
jgi:membrane peptidoglycan carboxypeptidase